MMTWKAQRDSFCVLRIWLVKGDPQSYYSLDWTSPRAQERDRELGLTRLRRLIAKRARMIQMAVIYDLQTNKALEYYPNGILLENNYLLSAYSNYPSQYRSNDPQQLNTNFNTENHENT